MPEDDIYLSGTAELILNSLRADELLNENELPILYAGFRPVSAAKPVPRERIPAA